MYIIVAIIILVALYYYFVMVKHGNLAFWKKAGKNPDFVYEQLSKDDAWLIDDGSVQIDKSGYDGPFMLYVPSLGKTIKFYGKVGQYEDSQKRIGEQL
jgi:hypothetical protein